MLPQRISFIHSKVSQIHAQLKPTKLAPNGDDIESGRWHQNGKITNSAAGLANKLVACFGISSSLCCCLRRQLFFAQCFKLLALFTVAIFHVLYLHPFLQFYTQMEEYSAKLDIRRVPSSASSAASLLPASAAIYPLHPLRPLLHDLADYKKNMWMTVAVLCIGLSTSSFFLFLLPSTSPIRKSYVILVGLIDAISFTCLPFLFSARAGIVQRLQQELGHALQLAHKFVSAERLMNEAKCSIQPREKLPFCSDLILRSLFPVDLLKFLLVLCALTLAYLLVAYLIYWCIKHWIPHQFHFAGCSTGLQHGSSSSARKFCDCCCRNGPTCQKRRAIEPFIKTYKPLRQADKYLVPLVVPNPLVSSSISSQQCSPVQLEEIPNEPLPPSSQAPTIP